MFINKFFTCLVLLLKPGPGHWTLDPDPNPGPWTRTMEPDPEKPGINIGLKNMSDFREFYEDHRQCELLFKSSCTNRYLN